MNKEQCKDILCVLEYIEYAVRVIDREISTNVSAPKEVFESLNIQTSFIKHCLNDINKQLKTESES